MEMTEKRFNVFDVDETIFLEDHKEGSYHIGEIGNVDVNCLNDIADRLNELHEENQRLKSDLARVIEQARKNNELCVSDIRILEKALWCSGCENDYNRLRQLRKEFLK
jgi:hypothetical protein